MKGAKGGLRDQIISKEFYEKMEELKKNFEDDAVLDYEEKEKSLEEETVNVSPLVDKDIDNVLIEKKKDIVTDEKTELEEQEEKDKRIEEQKEEVKITEENILTTEETKEKEIKEETEVKIEEEKLKEETNSIEESEETKQAEKQELEEEIEDQIGSDELIILYQLEKMIREDYYELKDIEYKIDVISIKEDQTLLKEDIKALKSELESLLERFDQLKDKYKIFDIGDLPDVDSSYISTLLRDYKLGVKGNSEINSLIKKIEETKRSIGIIETIIITEQKKDDLNEQLEDKYEKYDIRDKEFEELEDKVSNIDTIQREIATLSYDLEKSLNDLEKKVTDTIIIENKVERIVKRVPNINKVLSSALMFAVASKMPKSPIGNVAKAFFIAAAINDMSNIIEQKEEVRHTKTVSYMDFSKEILKSEKDLKNISYMIDDALLEVRNITYYFEVELKEYADQIPEYKELLSNLETIEEQL